MAVADMRVIGAGTWLLLVWLAWCAACPAQWLDRGLAHQTGGAWRLSESAGSLWLGQAQLVHLTPDGEVQVLAPLRWRFQPGALRRWQLAWALQVGESGMQIAIGRHGASIEGADGVLPDAVLRIFTPDHRANTVQRRGLFM